MLPQPEAKPNAAPPQAARGGSERDQISRNIRAVLGFYKHEEGKIGYWQRVLERLGLLIGQPAFMGFIVFFVVLWALANTLARELGLGEFDPAPYFWLQGLIGLSALLTTTVVLSKQNRLAGLEEQRAHLDLKVNLLTEQKAAKLIDLLEELRRDLPNVRNQLDPEAAALQQSMSPEQVLAALAERKPEPDGALAGAVDTLPLEDVAVLDKLRE